LGALFLGKSAISKAIEILKEEAFYSEVNKTIYKTILSLYDRNKTVDILTLIEELKAQGKLETQVDTNYLVELSTITPSIANIENHSLIVFEKYLRRRVIETTGLVIDSAFDETKDIVTEIDVAEAEMFKIAEMRFIKSYSNLKTKLVETYHLIETLRNRDKDTLAGVPSGIIELDKLTGGFQNSDLIIVAARPSMGKTAFALSVARNVAVNYKMPVAFFSIEMASTQIILRLISQEAKVDQQKLRTGRINDIENKRIVNSLNTLSQTNLFIDDSSSLTVMELRAKCRRLKTEHGIRLIMVDYLQIMHAPKAESREREISIISQSLKQIAKELDVPVIALAQLNRAIDGRTDKRPVLSDLRESGSIEQDADVVMFLNRPEVYKKEKYEDGLPTEGTGEIIVGKQRNGPIDTVRVAFIKDFARFENLAYSYENPPQSKKYESDDEPGF
jgi:replicative DNA helicase